MAMEKRVFGRTGIQLSIVGFGCGAVGGLMVRGENGRPPREKVKNNPMQGNVIRGDRDT
jgi:aryl-alcohol dehydrogenase-like predicted oxidoreductase